MRLIITIMTLALLSEVSVVQAVTVEYLLGDIDEFTYNGQGSIDDVYVSSEWLSEWEDREEPINGFDVFENEQLVLFTFLYDLAEGEEVVDATLTIAMKSIVPDSSNHSLVLGDSLGAVLIRPSFTDLSWEPISETETTIRSVSLDNVISDNMIPYLQEGVLNVAINRDVAVDYATLTLEVVPEPATLLLLGFGGLLIRKRR